MKFEHVFAIILTLIISAALGFALYSHDKELTITFGGALTTAFGGVIAYIFTKHIPGQENQKPPTGGDPS